MAKMNISECPVCGRSVPSRPGEISCNIMAHVDRINENNPQYIMDIRSGVGTSFASGFMGIILNLLEDGNLLVASTRLRRPGEEKIAYIS